MLELFSIPTGSHVATSSYFRMFIYLGLGAIVTHATNALCNSFVGFCILCFANELVDHRAHSVYSFVLLSQRCIAIKPEGSLSFCPECARETTGLVLFPMSFREIDEARKTVAVLANTGRRGRKRKNSESGTEEKCAYVSERRTGRWTPEETAYCDVLIDKFAAGQLPLAEGIKLNDFLGSMLKSKQSRLTKKMKNAKLSSKTFERVLGHVGDHNDARDFSEVEDSFFHSIQCHQERAEIKFHMQKEWREMFSNYCAAVGQPLDADAWLSSVEEMDRRASHAKDAARMSRRKIMMGHALRLDSKNPDSGVFIEKSEAEKLLDQNSPDCIDHDSLDAEEELLAFFSEKPTFDEKTKSIPGFGESNSKNSLLHSAPFLSKAISYMQRHSVPFEHIDIWVPSFVPTTGEHSAEEAGNTTCRLCYAGSATVDLKVDQEGKCYVPVSEEEAFYLHAFGDYSQKFSFDVGCGLPGRVYQSGLPTWEQSVQNAPHHHFERCGGARNFGIKTVVGIPIASPNVGRIVVNLYSRHDRNKDQELVGRLSEEFSRLMPSPKWKLVVDIGDPEPVETLISCPTTASIGASAHQQSMLTTSLTASVPTSTNHHHMHQQMPETTNMVSMHTHAPPESFPLASASSDKDHRIDELVSLLGEYMPSDPHSHLGSYIQGFMSLRLMLLRPNRSQVEEDLVRTMLGSFSSYTSGGRAKNDIALMLARDFVFLTQSQVHQPQQLLPQAHSFLQVGQSVMMPPSSGSNHFSFFGIPSSANYSENSYHNSPALAPIQLSGNGTDTLSIVST